MLWDHPVAHRAINPLKLKREYCVYCKTPLKAISLPRVDDGWRAVLTCTACGWWWLQHGINHIGHFLFEGTHGILKELDLTNIETPLNEVRQYLLAKYEARYALDWRLFEDVVASVFRDSGYQAVVTARQGDGGLDVILNGQGERLVGVQVKRYRTRIMVDQIREFVGALVLKGFTEGIFVTTSGFTLGAREAALDATHVGIPIHLLDAQRFLDALKISTRAEIPTPDEWVERLTNVNCIAYDTAGFVDSLYARAKSMHSYYQDRGELIPDTRAVEERARRVLKHRGYIGTYRFEDSVRLYIGSAEHPEGDSIPFDFEIEDQAKRVFRETVDTRLTWLEFFSLFVTNTDQP